MTPATGRAPEPAFDAIGLSCALAAFVSWALFPLYFKLLAAVPAVEVLAHRVVWSVPVAAVLITAGRRWLAVANAVGRRRVVMLLALAAVIVAANWGIFIWAVGHDHVLDSSLGYYISPLVSVVLGVVVLGERLSPLQWAGVALAAVGVGYQLVGLGTVPWVALGLASSWAAYGLIRKTVAADALTGLFVETLILLPLAGGYLMALAADGSGAFAADDRRLDALLAFLGVLTALPLLLFVVGARRIRLSTLGLLQYVVPTGQFLLAVLAFDEPLSGDRLVTFACIWTALALYSIDALRARPAPAAGRDG